MPEHKGSWYPVGDVKWDQNGAPYRDTSDGLKSYIPPIAAAQYRDDPRMLAWAKSKGASIDYQTDPTTGQVSVGPGGVQTGTKAGTFWHGGSQWNSEEGGYTEPFNWGNLLAVGIGGAIAAPFVAGAIAGAAGGGAASGGAAAGSSAAGAGIPAASLTGAGSLATGAAASGAVPAALGASIPAASLTGASALVPGVVSSGAVPAATGAGGGMGWASLLGGKYGLLIDAGTEVAKGVIGAKAAKDAAATQSAAADKALQFQREQYANQQQQFAPYLAAGQGAVGQLSSMAARPVPQFVPGQPQTFGQLGMPQGQPQMPQGMPPQPVSRPMGGAMPPPSQGRLVLVQAPTGETQRMPEALAQQAVQKGARVIG